jgi:hypothetical protein
VLGDAEDLDNPQEELLQLTTSVVTEWMNPDRNGNMRCRVDVSKVLAEIRGIKHEDQDKPHRKRTKRSPAAAKYRRILPSSFISINRLIFQPTTTYMTVIGG